MRAASLRSPLVASRHTDAYCSPDKYLATWRELEKAVDAGKVRINEVYWIDAYVLRRCILRRASITSTPLRGSP